MPPVAHEDGDPAVLSAAHPPGPPDAVQVVCNCVGEVEEDHVIHLRRGGEGEEARRVWWSVWHRVAVESSSPGHLCHVDAPRRNVRAYEDLSFSVNEFFQQALAVLEEALVTIFTSQFNSLVL